jgi:hypothetical protein
MKITVDQFKDASWEGNFASSKNMSRVAAM